LEEKKQDSGEPCDKMFVFDSRHGEVREASLEVERILLALEDSEKDQKSPLGPDPRETFVADPQYSPPLRPISPPARSQNPQAEAIEAMWREQEVVDSDECLPLAGERVFDDFSDNEDEITAIHQFQSQRPTFHSFTEPSSPYSAPPFLPSTIKLRRNSIPGDEDDDIDGEDADVVFISPPNSMQDHDDSGIFHEDSPYHLPLEPESCPITIEIPGPSSVRRFQSLPGSGPSSGTNSSKRKRGKPRYESRSLPTAVGCDLLLTRTLRTLSATERSASRT